MQRYKVITLPMAEEDILSNTDYIAFDKKSPGTALELGYGFRKTIETLSTYPYRHELDDDQILADYGVRKIYYKNYKIFYVVKKEAKMVYILGVLHMLVDSKSLLLRRIK
jgi:plasmid stabilization system protein ParE